MIERKSVRQSDRYLPSFDGMTPMTIGELEFIKIISVE
jgi:hypothetical protein